MRKIRIVIFVLIALVSIGPQAFAAAKGDTLNAEEAKAILSELIPNVKIIHVKQAPVAGLWEIGIDMNGQKAIVYLDHSKKHIISPITRGEIYDIKTKTSLTQESFQKINKVDVSKIPLKDALVLGDKTAKNKIIVFSDPD
jgi:thiol:disulfide interchange protein DsbC